MKYFMGIDPGASGGFALIPEEGPPVVHPYTDTAFLDACRVYGPNVTFCIIEEVHSMPKQGVASSFNFGKTYGYLLGVLEAMRIPYQTAPPRVWKKEYGLNSDKLKSIEVTHRLFPDVSLRRTEKCKVDHDGMAEALLMAEYARRRHGF